MKKICPKKMFFEPLPDVSPEKNFWLCFFWMSGKVFLTFFFECAEKFLPLPPPPPPRSPTFFGKDMAPKKNFATGPRISLIGPGPSPFVHRQMTWINTYRWKKFTFVHSWKVLLMENIEWKFVYILLDIIRNRCEKCVSRSLAGIEPAALLFRCSTLTNCSILASPKVSFFAAVPG